MKKFFVLFFLREVNVKLWVKRLWKIEKKERYGSKYKAFVCGKQIFGRIFVRLFINRKASRGVFIIFIFL